MAGPAGNRYLVLGLGAGPAADLGLPPDRDGLIAYGPLLSDDGATWLGTAALIRARDPDAARAVLTRGPVRRRRGAQLAIRRATVVAGSRKMPAHSGVSAVVVAVQRQPDALQPDDEHELQAATGDGDAPGRRGCRR